MLVNPEVLADSAQSLSRIGSSVAEAASSALSPTTGILPMAADEITSAVTRLFSGHGLEFQRINAQAEQFQSQFVSLLNTSAAQYASAESVNDSILGLVNSPTMALLGRPLIGNGAAGGVDIRGNGTAGGAGGLLWGNGGRGGDATAISGSGGSGGAGGMFGNGGAGGNGGPSGQVIIVKNGVPTPVEFRGGAGGTGGQGGWLFGNGGVGGFGGSGLANGLGGWGGRGGDAVLFGAGGDGGTGGDVSQSDPVQSPGVGGYGGTGGGIPNLLPGIFPNGATGNSGNIVP